MISVLVSAYQAEDYLEDLLKSIDLPGVEVMIAVDNCFDTYLKAKELKKKYSFRLFDSNINNGPYLNINSLAMEASNDYILPFGADDHFKAGALKKIASMMGPDRSCRFWYTNYKGNKYIKQMQTPAEGAFCIDRAFFIEIGGFKGWRVASDTELRLRAEFNGIFNTVIEEPLFMRRLHDKALTQAKSTGVGSKVRADAMQYIIDNRGNRPPIKYKTVKIKEI